MPRARRLHPRGFFRRAIGDMFRNLPQLGSHLGGTCAERHSTIRGFHPAANRSSGSWMNFLSKRIGGHLSRGFPRGTAVFLLSTHATISTRRSDPEDPIASDSQPPSESYCVWGWIPGASVSQGEPAGRLLRPPPHNSQRKCVASQIASNGRPAIPDPPFSFPTKSTEQSRTITLHNSHSPAVVWRQAWNMGKAGEARESQDGLSPPSGVCGCQKSGVT
jgi:hypothetical protein